MGQRDWTPGMLRIAGSPSPEITIPGVQSSFHQERQRSETPPLGLIPMFPVEHFGLDY